MRKDAKLFKLLSGKTYYVLPGQVVGIYNVSLAVGMSAKSNGPKSTDAMPTSVRHLNGNHNPTRAKAHVLLANGLALTSCSAASEELPCRGEGHQGAGSHSPPSAAGPQVHRFHCCSPATDPRGSKSNPKGKGRRGRCYCAY